MGSCSFATQRDPLRRIVGISNAKLDDRGRIHRLAVGCCLGISISIDYLQFQHRRSTFLPVSDDFALQRGLADGKNIRLAGVKQSAKRSRPPRRVLAGPKIKDFAARTSRAYPRQKDPLEA